MKNSRHFQLNEIILIRAITKEYMQKNDLIHVYKITKLYNIFIVTVDLLHDVLSWFDAG